MRRLTIGFLAVLGLSACEGVGDGGAGPYSEECKETSPSGPILDTTGTFAVSGAEGLPTTFPVGANVGGTGSLNLFACVPSDDDEILDRLNFDLELVLFDIDDQAIDLPVADDATSVEVLWGTVTDWDDVTGWFEDGGSGFVHFARGSSSFSELDKDGRLVGTIDVTETDPAGHAMTVDIDLSW